MHTIDLKQSVRYFLKKKKNRVYQRTRKNCNSEYANNASHVQVY